MLRVRFIRSKLLILGIVASVSLLFFPHGAFGQVRTGSLSEFVYLDDMKSPLEGAVVKLRNILSGAVYQSGPTDKNGFYVIPDIIEGRYLLGISTQKGDFNFDSELQIKAQELAKLNLVLKADQIRALVEGARVGAENPTGFFKTPRGVAVTVPDAGTVMAGPIALGGSKKDPPPPPSPPIKPPRASPYRR